MLYLCLVFFCFQKSKSDILQHQIEDQVKSGMHDPDSYEFNHYYIDSLLSDITKSMIARTQKEIDSLSKQNTESNIIRIKKLDEEIVRYKLKFPHKFNGEFSFRGNNKFGAKILVEYTFIADSAYKLLYLMDNSGDTIYRDADIFMEEINNLIENNESH